MNQEYQTGFTMGTIAGEKDSNLLIPPYPYTEVGTEIYKEGFTSGYFIRYTEGLSTQLKSNSNQELQKIISTRLEEIKDYMNNHNKKQK